jgi:N-acetylglucosaminyl-diphospho-decaprenol L-rhamnosyltransferase
MAHQRRRLHHELKLSTRGRGDARTRGENDAATRVSEITAVIVSWRDAEQVEEAIESLVRARGKITGAGPRVSVVVVDNGSGLQGRGRVQAICPDATLIANGSNRGLAAASNQGARAASGDVLLFLNPDTRAEGDPFSEIRRAFTEHPEAVAVAPRLFDLEEEPERGTELAPADREDQRTFQLRHLPSLALDARHLLLLDHLLPNNSSRRRERYAEADREKAFAVEQAAAAALAVRREAFERIGGFDERFFPAWFEDVDLCQRLGALGAILYWPAARFRHRGRTSSETLGYERFLPIYYTNALRYRRRYSPIARVAYRALLAVGMTLRLTALPFRRRMPRPRTEAAPAYLRTLLVAFGHVPRSCQLSAVGAQLTQ